MLVLEYDLPDDRKEQTSSKERNRYELNWQILAERLELSRRSKMLDADIVNANVLIIEYNLIDLKEYLCLNMKEMLL